MTLSMLKKAMEGVNTQKKLKKYKPLLRLLCVNLNKATKLW